jgi:hypothetical protein
VIGAEPQMAFIDDARHSGKELYGAHRQPWPRHYYTWIALGTSLLLWAMILAVLHLF